MIIDRHPSDSSEQQLAHKEILSLLNEKYQLNLESKKVLINDTLFQVDGYLPCFKFFLRHIKRNALKNSMKRNVKKENLFERVRE